MARNEGCREPSSIGLGITFAVRSLPLPTAGPSLLAPEGRFGSALDPRSGCVAVASRPEYQEPPRTVEVWAKLDGQTGYNIIVASSLKASSSHWELYTVAGTGTFAAFLPGASPQVIDSGIDVVDGSWHYLVMTHEKDRVRLYVDARKVTDTVQTPGVGTPQPGPIWVGGYPPGSIGCDGLIDELRISRGVREIVRVPDRPFAADGQTLGLWHLDTSDFTDSSALANPASEALAVAALPAASQAAGPSGPGSVDYKVADDRLRVELIDRVPGESLLSVRADAEGRLFVGGREALFVYEPEDSGGYKPRQLLYRFPEHTWLNDITIRGNDLYVMTNAALYIFREGRTRRDGLTPERLVWGWPVDLHVTLHGMAWGPDGKLYITAGDPLLNHGDMQNRPDHWGHWTIATATGQRIPYTGQGGVFRFGPDGRFQSVHATGLRGPFGLCFDRRWELFTNDNDHESMPAAYSPARLLHVVEGADFAWPRGWMAGKSPDRADLLETMDEGAGLGREVPVGMAYHDDTLLPEPYRDSLLLARWGQRRIDAFRLIPRGASYAVEEHPLLIGENTARPMGVTVGRGGRVFGVISYMQNNEWSPSYVADLVMITTKDDPADASVRAA